MRHATMSSSLHLWSLRQIVDSFRNSNADGARNPMNPITVSALTLHISLLIEGDGRRATCRLPAR